MAVKEEKLFGYPKWEVEDLAGTITKAREAEGLKPNLYNAALKLLDRRQKAIVAILKSAKSKRG